MLRYATTRKLDLSDSRVTARVGIGTLKSGGIGLAAALDLDAPRLSRADAVYLMERAHESCPYSRATRGNIEVTLTVGGTAIELVAA
jgi:organic hydroperoxide reductase OsmC/OhrA